uniref:KRAB domain-containing protein n=1 Tax=Papio anubis TaxID=9555 RepID=A0A8I5NJJ4_PAPAN
MQTDLQGEAQIRSAEVSLLAIVAAIQVVEKKMEPQAAWLQSLEGRTRTAEEKLADCEKVAVKFGNQTVAQAGGQVGHVGDSAAGVRAAAEAAGEHAVQQKLLDPVAAPGSKGEAPKVPVTPEDTVGYFSEQQGGGLEDSQKELYKRVVKGSCETLSSLGRATTKPDLLVPVEKGHQAGSCSLPSAERGQSPGPGESLRV